ncbi:LacI family DNA-binding transcriptional regulator [Vallitalea okinawensis]|uniref:LacI family DNA-binding transcriptional regulator n=1 Tax=Vallitalea okinawensis TaxID=2078660 RepID=UPI001479660F|nr:LacI family DNA-binding transcriptional regulator [Vallitalea okinawensis]
MMNIKKVAEFAGVSTATVSRVINSSGPVSEKNRVKVMEAINVLEYRPNTRAREFRMNRSNELITILNDICNPIFAEAIKGMEDVAYENKYHLLIGNTSNNKMREQKYLESLKMGKADGAILITPRIGKKALLELHDRVPIVLMNDYMVDEIIPSVGINDYGASYDMTQYIIKNGHLRIGYIAGNQKVSIAKERKKGFEMALKDNKIPLIDQWVFQAEHTIEGGYQVMKKMMNMADRPTALVCYNDEIAIGVIKCATEEGIKIPEHLSVVGFDNINTSTIISPALTTIHQSAYELGRQAVEMLITLINGEDLKKRRITLDYQLKIRDTVKKLMK